MGGMSGVMACTKESALKKPETPLERFFSEQHRHERIAFMMRGDEHKAASSKWPIDGHAASTRQAAPFAVGPQYIQDRGHHEDILMKDAGEPSAAAAANPKHSTSPFRVELEVNGSDNMEDDPHLQEIRIAARIK
jgi:hypothetical protein